MHGMSGLSYHFSLIYVYYWATYLWLLTIICFANFSSLILLFISLICQGLTRVFGLHKYGVVIKSMYSYSSGQPSPLHSGFWNNRSIAITFMQQSLDWYISVHSNESQQFVVSNISFGWKLARSVGIIVSTLRCCFYSIYSHLFGQPFPLHFLIWKKHSIPISSAGVSRLVHFSAPQCN